MEDSFEINNEIEHLAKKIMEKKTRSEFLRGYNESLKVAQTTDENLPEHFHLKNGMKDPYNFGKHLGALVGILRFQPKKVLESIEQANFFIESLNLLKESAEFFAFVHENIQRWQKKIKPHFNNLEEFEKRVFMKFISVI